MTVTLGITCEDRGHFTVVSKLVDRALLDSHGWLDGVLDDVRKWRGPSERGYKYDPDDVRNLRAFDFAGQRIQPLGRIRGEPLEPEAAMWRKVLLLFCHADPRPEVVVLVRDLDGYERRRSGMEQVRRGFTWPFEVVLATPQPEIEAWLVAGFEPADDDERARLDALRSELSFDPTTASHRLTSHPNDASTDAKRVLAKLVDDDEERGMACLDDRERLRARGSDNGLAAFLGEVERHIVPCFGGSGA